MTIFMARSVEECTYSETISNPDGVEYLEFSCLHPLLGFLYTDLERDIETYGPCMNSVWHFMRSNPMFPWQICAMYGTLIVLGRKYFGSRQPWNCRWALSAWNLGLSMFSFVGMIRTLPVVLWMLNERPIADHLCKDIEFEYGRGSQGLWVQLFILSKFPELFDTFFIIVHKKPLVFLHWYHHVTVLLFTWYSYTNKTPSGPIFIAMNYSVHSLMYGYYFLVSVRKKPAWFSPIIVTASQICQMFVGCAITFMTSYYYIVDDTCRIQPVAMLAGCLMYGSYLSLFIQFFMGKYPIIRGPYKDDKLKFF